MFGKMMNSFYYGKSGKGDFRKEDLPKNRWQLFWEMLRVRFSSLVRLNLMTIAAWLPMIILIGYCISTIFNAMVVSSDYLTYQQTGDLGNLTEDQVQAIVASGIDVERLVGDVIHNMVYTFCLWCIPCILITGPVKAGVAYVTRNWARDEHAFIWSDFKDAVKENWKQALGISAITSVLPLVVYLAYQFYGEQARSSMIFMVPQMLVVMLGIVWALGCLFFYPVIVTYKVSFSQLIKNGLIMAVARLPQTVGIRLLLLLPVALCAAAFLLTGSLIAFLVLGGYYILLGYALSRFIGASYTNGVFDKYINSHMEGVQINRGLATESDDDEEDEEDEENNPASPQ
ncbi:MAG: YesL family protein [Clostridia bacterium]|nr:YesL family protein [Clostridia bacterium]